MPIWEEGRDAYMGGGTGRLPGRVVKQDLAMHVYNTIYILFVLFRLYGKNFARTFFVPSIK